MDKKHADAISYRVVAKILHSAREKGAMALLDDDARLDSLVQLRQLDKSLVDQRSTLGLPRRLAIVSLSARRKRCASGRCVAQALLVDTLVCKCPENPL